MHLFAGPGQFEELLVFGDKSGVAFQQYAVFAWADPHVL